MNRRPLVVRTREHIWARPEPVRPSLPRPRTSTALQLGALRTSAMTVGLLAASARGSVSPAIIANVVACVALDTVARRARPRRWSSPIALYGWSHLLLFVIRPTLDLRAGEIGVGFHTVPPEAAVSNALYLTALGGCSVALGALVGIQSDHRRGNRPASSRSSVSLLVQTSWIVIGYVVLAYGAFLAQIGGPGTLLGGRNALAEGQRTSFGFLYDAPLALIGLGALWLAFGRRRVGALLVSAAIIPSVLAGNRSYLLIGAITVVAILPTRSRPQWTTIFRRIAAVVVVVVLFAALQSWRADGYSSTGADGLLISPFRAARIILTSEDTAMYPALAILVDQVPQDLSYGGGSTIYAAAVQPIPSPLMPDKPPPADATMTELLLTQDSNRGTGFAFSLFGELYYIGGVVPLVLAALLIGYVIGRISRLSIGGTHLRLAGYGVVAAMVPVFIRGSIGADGLRALICLSPMVIWKVLGYYAKSRRAPLGPAHWASGLTVGHGQPIA